MTVTKSASRWARGVGGVMLALLLATCAAGVSGGELVSVSGTWGWSHYNPDVIRLDCRSSRELSGAEQLEEVHVPPFNRTEMQLLYPNTNWTMLGAKLVLDSCPSPNGWFVVALGMLKYPIAQLEELYLSWPYGGRPPHADHFAGLRLKTIRIYFNFFNMQTNTVQDKRNFNPDIFSSLTELSELKIWGAIVPPMSSISRVRVLALEYGQSMGAWGSCAELRELNLDHWEVLGAEEDEGWLAHCPQLSTVRAHWMTAASLVQLMRGVRALTALEILSLSELSAMQLDSMFSGLRLQQLTFSYDMFRLMSESTLSTSLVKLHLYNARRSSDVEENQRVVRRLARLPALRDLELKTSFEANFCELFSKNGSLPALQRLSLTNFDIEKFCFSGWDSLEYLEFHYSDIHELELLQLTPARAHPLLVDLHHTTVSEIPLDEAGYNLLLARFSKTTNVTVQGDIELNCDCEHAWLARALRTLPLSMPGARCVDYSNASLLDVPAERLECDKSECGNCTCRRAWRDNATAATCGRDTTRVPRAPGLHALHAAGSRIDALHADDLPDTLLTLDLTNNKILRLDQSAVDALFSVSARVIWLAGNPLACDCAARPLLSALQRHRAQLRDFERVTCADGRAVHALTVDALCSPQDNPSTPLTSL